MFTLTVFSPTMEPEKEGSKCCTFQETEARRNTRWASMGIEQEARHIRICQASFVCKMQTKAWHSLWSAWRKRAGNSKELRRSKGRNMQVQTLDYLEHTHTHLWASVLQVSQRANASCSMQQGCPKMLLHPSTSLIRNASALYRNVSFHRMSW